MATPASNAKTPIRPYRRFLNSILHTRLQHASLLALLLSWDNAFWIGSRTSCKSTPDLFALEMLIDFQFSGHGFHWGLRAYGPSSSSSPP
jgi:hypothetical protein